MSWGLYGILIVFGLFIVLMIFNPSLSCFGKRIRSPFYPLIRRKKQKKIQAEDYGFDLEEGNQAAKQEEKKENNSTR